MNRCAAICGLLLTLAGCGTPASPPQAATGATRGQAVADGRVSYRSPSGLRDNAWRILAGQGHQLADGTCRTAPTRATVTAVGRAALREASHAH